MSDGMEEPARNRLLLPRYMNREGGGKTLSLHAPLILLVSLVAYLFVEGFILDFSAKPYATTLTAHHRRQCRFASVSAQLAALPRTSIIREAERVAEDLKNEAQSSHELPTAVLFLSDSKYDLRFGEMTKTWSQFADRSNLVMAALDNATAAYFQERGIKTVRVFPEDTKPESSMREAVLQTKTAIPYVFLLKGLKVIMVEMDIYCRENPLTIDHSTADILVAKHDYCEEVNVGFWIAYPTCPAIDSFRRMYAWTSNLNRENAYCDGAFDQKLMHYAWLGRGALSENSGSACQVFSQRNQVFDPQVNTPVALQRISVQHIMHWPLQGGDRDNWPDSSSNPACVHIWSGFGSPHQQIRYGYGRGWYPLESETDGKDALGRLDFLDLRKRE